MKINKSPMGFKYYGDAEDITAIARHCKVGTVPEEFCVYIFKFFIPKSKVMLDVGANTGIFCCVMAHENPDCKIIAYEPSEKDAEQLKATIKANGWKNFLVRKVALSNKEETKTLYHMGTGTTLKAEFNDYRYQNTSKVITKKLDEEMRILKLKVDFIKIDVEGYEQYVLEGAEKTISRDKPTMFIEITDKMADRKNQNPNYAKTINWLWRHNYRLFRCDEGSIKGIASIKEITEIKPSGHVKNYLCVHKDDQETLRSIRKYTKKYVYYFVKNLFKRVIWRLQ